MFQSTEDPLKLNSFAKALTNLKVNIGDENIIMSEDISLPRVAFISNRSRRERNPKIIELALNSALVSGSSNVLKAGNPRTLIGQIEPEERPERCVDLLKRQGFLKRALLRLESVLLNDMVYINRG